LAKVEARLRLAETATASLASSVVTEQLRNLSQILRRIVNSWRVIPPSRQKFRYTSRLIEDLLEDLEDVRRTAEAPAR
jgi:hypothetical protein